MIDSPSTDEAGEVSNHVIIDRLLVVGRAVDKDRRQASLAASVGRPWAKILIRRHHPHRSPRGSVLDGGDEVLCHPVVGATGRGSGVRAFCHELNGLWRKEVQVIQHCVISDWSLVAMPCDCIDVISAGALQHPGRVDGLVRIMIVSHEFDIALVHEAAQAAQQHVGLIDGVQVHGRSSSDVVQRLVLGGYAVDRYSHFFESIHVPSKILDR